MPVHGGSLRLYWQRDKFKAQISVKAKDLLNQEKKLDLTSPRRYNRFAHRVQRLKQQLTSKLQQLKQKNKSIMGYGAAAKGNVLLNFCQLGPDIIDSIVDSIPFKQGLYTPGTKIPIYPEKKLLQDMPDYTLLLAWNFAEEIIIKQNLYQEKGGKFIIAIPQLQII